ncbi:MAG: sulfurtransferase TusA family protein [Aggregatibacter sp.]
MEYQLDTRAYRCPLPLLMTKNAVNTLAPNDVLTVWLSAESDIEDFRLFCEAQQLFIDFEDQAQRILKIKKKCE